MCAGNVPLPIPKPVCPLACCNRNWKHRAPLLSPPSSPPCPASGGPCQGTWLQDASHNGKQTANNKTTHLKAGGRGIGIDQIAQSVRSFAGPQLLFSNPCQALRAPRLTSGKASVCEVSTNKIAGAVRAKATQLTWNKMTALVTKDHHYYYCCCAVWLGSEWWSAGGNLGLVCQAIQINARQALPQ